MSIFTQINFSIKKSGLSIITERPLLETAFARHWNYCNSIRLSVKLLKLRSSQLFIAMPKPNQEVKGIVITSHGTEAKCNLKAKARKLREMGASPLVLRMFGDENDE